LYVGGEVSDSIPDTLITAYHSVGGNTDFFVLKYGVDCSCTSMPVAAYTTTGTSVVDVTYTGTTTGLDSVVWNYGDGTTDTGITTSHTYTVVGTVDLCVTVYTGCGQDTHCGNITVNCTGAITSAFTNAGTTVRTYTYTGTTTALDSVIWNFGDGHTATGTTAAHTYSTSGTYTVCATAYTGCGSNTACDTVEIDCAPTSSFSHSGTSTADFTYTGTTTSLDSVVWNYGDGHRGTGLTSSHTYSLSGTYSLCATVYTACGSNTSCDTITINCTPASSFTYSGTDPVIFTYTGTTPGLDSIVWHFGDGTSGTGTTITHTYTAAGTYSVCATAYGLCGNNTSCSLITLDCLPTASFTTTGTITRDFTYTGTTAGVDSVVWNFGDASSATGTSATHTYTAVGTYTLCVTAYSPCGENKSCTTITISCITAPVANFIETGSNPYSFGYIGTIAGYDSLIWTYGDGSSFSGSGTAFETVHTYTAPGTYVACVTVFTSCGIDSACKDIVVHTVGVPSVSIVDIQVYPNPAGDELNVTGVLQNTNYRLLTVTGVAISEGLLHSGSNTIVTKNITPGVYVLELTNLDGGKDIKRVLKE